MQPQQGSRIDLGDLKAQIVKKIGVEKSKRYFYYLSRFLSQKLSKSEFDKSCYRVLGRENLPLHNQLIRSILKNACQAKNPPPIHESGPAKSVVQTAKCSPGREDGLEQTVSLVPSQNTNISIWTNGVLPVSPRKIRSGIRERKHRDRPSPLGPNGRLECLSHQSTGTEDTCNKANIENGNLTPCDYERPLQHLQSVAEQPDNERDGSGLRPNRIPGKDQAETLLVEDGEEVEQANRLNLSKSPLLAPLGIPFCPASVGGTRKTVPVSTSGDFVSYYDSGVLTDSETLRKRMELIAAAQGLGGVSMESANMLNIMLDVYLKKLIKSCVDLIGARTAHELRKNPIHKQQIQGKIVNGMWPSNHLHAQNSSGPMDSMEDRRSPCLISLLDFKVAMELNPHQLGEDWPMLLEKICMHSFEE
ncbi:uncharacterized protein LOC110818581 [Carica papaya]|uniref:uncharacterized protein LOC110818581 n=1 Tax=Carica papaya TaxID=3649 RepID=UPI000B8CB5DA|nr:uncharacterized protein LOC110818581 [Carica papaya]